MLGPAQSWRQSDEKKEWGAILWMSGNWRWSALLYLEMFGCAETGCQSMHTLNPPWAQFDVWIFKYKIFFMMYVNSLQSLLCILKGWSSLLSMANTQIALCLCSVVNYTIHLICSNFLLLFSLSFQPSIAQAHQPLFYFVKCWCFIGLLCCFCFSFDIPTW